MPSRHVIDARLMIFRAAGRLLAAALLGTPPRKMRHAADRHYYNLFRRRLAPMRAAAYFSRDADRAPMRAAIDDI